MITILLVDDHPAVRRGLRMRLALESDMTVVGETELCAALPALVAALDPDVVVMDTALGHSGDRACTALLREIASHCPVVVLSLRDDPLTQRQALAAGAAVFASKWEAHVVLFDVIRRIARLRLERSA